MRRTRRSGGFKADGRMRVRRISKTAVGHGAICRERESEYGMTAAFLREGEIKNVIGGKKGEGMGNRGQVGLWAFGLFCFSEKFVGNFVSLLDNG